MTEQTMLIQEVLARPQEITWLPWAVQYFFMIGIAACAALYACRQRWRGDKRDARLEMLAVFISITLGIAAPMALTADLHQTARVWHFYAYPTPWSWMPWGALFLPAFTGCIGLYFLALVADKIWHKQFKLTRWVALGSAVFAIGLLLYTGREVSVVRAHPIWFSYWIPVLLFFSALQALPALMMLGARREPQYQAQLARLQVVSLLLLAVCTGFWIAGDTVSGAAIRTQLRFGTTGWTLAMGEIVLWIALMVLSVRLLTRRGSVAYITVHALLTLFLTWSLRWLLLMQVQTLPKYNVMHNPYSLPMGTDGIQAIIGTIGLWIALVIIFREGIRRVNNKVQNQQKVAQDGGVQHG